MAVSGKEIAQGIALTNLREKAEASLRQIAGGGSIASSSDIRETLHELQVHRIELEMQNEQLRETQVELAQSRDRIADLYDLAPVGYVTLDESYLILDANLTIAHELGVMRHALLQRRFSRFIEHSFHEAYYLRLIALENQSEPQSLEVRIRRADKTYYWALLKMAPTDKASRSQGAFCRLSIIDITERKKAEQELQELNQTLELRVAERSAKLLEANLELRNEIAERERLEREIVEIAEHERRYFGLELHDDICQQIVAIGMYTDMLAGRMKKSDRKTASEIENLSSMLAQMLERTRELSRGLHPTGLESEGLVPALKALANQASVRVECVLAVPKSEVHIPKDAALQLYRIAQEAVSNALRHSRARQVEIALREAADSLVLTVTDDGTGIGEKCRLSLGFRSMSHRAKLIGATLAVQENLPHGTVVKCSLPNGRLH